MVTQVRGEEDVGSGIARGAKQAVAGAAGDGDGLDGGVEVSSDEEAGCGIRKCNGDGSGEVAQPCGVLEPADASNSLGGIIRAGRRRRGPRPRLRERRREWCGRSPGRCRRE